MCLHWLFSLCIGVVTIWVCLYIAVGFLQICVHVAECSLTAVHAHRSRATFNGFFYDHKVITVSRHS